MPETTVCHVCGRTRGSFQWTAAGWACLRHLPKLGRRANRDRAR